MYRPLYITNNTISESIDMGEGYNYIINNFDPGTADINNSYSQNKWGTFTYNQMLTGRTITIRGYILGDSYNEIFTRRAYLEMVLAPHSDLTLFLGAYNIDCYMRGTIEYGTEYYQNNEAFLYFTVRLYCDNPFFRAPLSVTDGNIRLKDEYLTGSVWKNVGTYTKTTPSSEAANLRMVLNNVGANAQPDDFTITVRGIDGTNLYVHRMIFYKGTTSQTLGTWYPPSPLIIHNSRSIKIDLNKQSFYYSYDRKEYGQYYTEGAYGDISTKVGENDIRIYCDIRDSGGYTLARDLNYDLSAHLEFANV